MRLRRYRFVFMLSAAVGKELNRRTKLFVLNDLRYLNLPCHRDQTDFVLLFLKLSPSRSCRKMGKIEWSEGERKNLMQKLCEDFFPFADESTFGQRSKIRLIKILSRSLAQLLQFSASKCFSSTRKSTGIFLNSDSRCHPNISHHLEGIPADEKKLLDIHFNPFQLAAEIPFVFTSRAISTLGSSIKHEIKVLAFIVCHLAAYYADSSHPEWGNSLATLPVEEKCWDESCGT